MTTYSREAGIVFACLVSGNAGAFFEMEISELTRAGKRTAGLNSRDCQHQKEHSERAGRVSTAVFCQQVLREFAWLIHLVPRAASMFIAVVWVVSLNQFISRGLCLR